MENLFLTQEQSQHLIDLGLNMNDAEFCWRRKIRTWDNREPNERYKKWEIERNQALVVQGFEIYETIPTYTLQEILEKLPIIVKENGTVKTVYTWKINSSSKTIEYSNGSKCLCAAQSCSILSAAYEMLYWVVKNGYLKVK